MSELVWTIGYLILAAVALGALVWIFVIKFPDDGGG